MPLERGNWRIVDAIKRIWEVERDLDALTEGIDRNSALIIRHILAALEGGSPPPPAAGAATPSPSPTGRGGGGRGAGVRSEAGGGTPPPHRTGRRTTPTDA